MNRRELLKSLLIAPVAASFVAITNRKPDLSDHAAYIQWHFDNGVPVPEGSYLLNRTVVARIGQRAVLRNSVIRATEQLGDSWMVYIPNGCDYNINGCTFVSSRAGLLTTFPL